MHAHEPWSVYLEVRRLFAGGGSLILPNGYLGKTQALRFGSKVIYLLSHLTGLKIVLQGVQTLDKVMSMFNNFSSEWLGSVVPSLPSISAVFLSHAPSSPSIFSLTSQILTMQISFILWKHTLYPFFLSNLHLSRILLQYSRLFLIQKRCCESRSFKQRYRTF